MTVLVPLFPGEVGRCSLLFALPLSGAHVILSLPRVGLQASLVSWVVSRLAFMKLKCPSRHIPCRHFSIALLLKPVHFLWASAAQSLHLARATHLPICPLLPSPFCRPQQLRWLLGLRGMDGLLKPLSYSASGACIMLPSHPLPSREISEVCVDLHPSLSAPHSHSI